MPLAKDISVCVIVATYNKPRYLKAVLQQLFLQDHLPNQIVIADDGSGNDTQTVLDELSNSHSNLVHVWHEDKGFQKCQILNKAISATDKQYIVFIDDDCLCPPWFISAHLDEARSNAFTVGSSVNLASDLTDKLLSGELCFKKFLDSGTLEKMRHVETKSRGGFWKLFFRTALTGKLLGKFFDRTYLGRGVFRGGNSGAWREDLVKINGFNNDMVYGHEDREIGERIRNLGRQCRQVRYYGANFHLDHDRSYADPEQKRRQRNMCKLARRQGTTAIPRGIKSPSN